MQKWIFVIMLPFLVLSSSTQAQSWNNPHQGGHGQNVYYAAITGSPKTLDPAKAYSHDEITIIGQIYEPVLQYHYLKRPYELEPLTAQSTPEVAYLNKEGHKLAANADPSEVAFSIYDIQLKPGIFYQPHPAFAKNTQGRYLYLNLSTAALDKIESFDDFTKTGTRELVAQDYIYEIKRLASPKTSSPIYGTMSKYIVGFSKFSNQLQAMLKKKGSKGFLDLRKYDLEGVKQLSRYHYQITIKGVYPQFKYWLAMTFFAPIPWEVDAFYSQPGLADNNITLSWYPVGTGPYMLVENNPNKRIVMVSNPNFHKDLYPSQGEPGDKGQGYLQDSGKKLPFIEKVILVLDKESIPRWNKFLQGYYDNSAIAADSFDQAIRMGKDGKPFLTERMKQQGIRLYTTVIPGIYYIGFNMDDPVVGGYSKKQKKLRQAISIAIDYQEYISIFLNGRGKAAQGPVPPDISGYQAGNKGINPYVYEWKKGKLKRHSIGYAKKLLEEAGYPNGINPETNKPLILNFDVATSGSPDDKAYFSWLRDQFAKLGVKLNIRATLYNRFQDKVRVGEVQMFSWGWLADYPDAENFLFLLYGPNGRVKFGGENTANYDNPQVNALFEQIRVMPEGEARNHKIQQLISIVQADSPWVFGFYPISFTLSHQWVQKTKVNPMVKNTLKYIKINVQQRDKLRYQWNQARMWPFAALAGLLLIIVIPLGITYYHRENKPAVKRKKDE